MAVSSDVDQQVVVSVTLIGLLLSGLFAPVVSGTTAIQQSQPETDNTVTRIEVYENGSARWTIRIRTRLDTEQRVADYQAFQERFRNNTDQYLGPFRTRMQSVVADAENATGRRMRATNFTASTSIQQAPRRWGIVTYKFTWTNFAAEQNNSVIVGDVFQGGFFIAANDSLQVVAPDTYTIARVEPEPDSQEDDMVTWTGREDFADNHPRVVFVPVDTQSEQPDSARPSSGDFPVEAVILGLVALGVLVGASIYRYRQQDQVVGGHSEGTVETGSASTEEINDGSNEQPPNTNEDDIIKTDEERVRDLLKANDGRMRQAEIAETFDWSASKTSRVIGEMADNDSVNKLRLGRENLVELVDDDA